MKKSFFNKSIRFLLITNGLVLLSGAMLGPIYALFVEKIGGSLLEASLTGGIFAFAAGITTLFAGKYTDKLNKSKLIMIIGYLFMAAGFFLYTQVNSITSLFLIQIIIGFGGAIYAPAFDTLYSKHITKTKAGREWGAWESMNYFALAGGAVVGGFIATYFGFNPLFIIMGILTLASAAWIYFSPKEIV